MEKNEKLTIKDMVEVIAEIEMAHDVFILRTIPISSITYLMCRRTTLTFLNKKGL